MWRVLGGEGGGVVSRRQQTRARLGEDTLALSLLSLYLCDPLV